jgi:hypothetical protein
VWRCCRHRLKGELRDLHDAMIRTGQQLLALRDRE